MFNKDSQLHQDNLSFILKSLQNKPITADLFIQILHWNARNLSQVEVVFPARKVPSIEFRDEQISKGLSSFVNTDKDTDEIQILKCNQKLYF